MQQRQQQRRPADLGPFSHRVIVDDDSRSRLDFVRVDCGRVAERRVALAINACGIGARIEEKTHNLD